MRNPLDSYFACDTCCCFADQFSTRLIVKPTHSGFRFHAVNQHAIGIDIKMIQILSSFYIYTNVFPQNYLENTLAAKWCIFRQNVFLSKILTYFWRKDIQKKCNNHWNHTWCEDSFFFLSLHPSKISYLDVNPWPFLVSLRETLPVSHLINEQYLIWAWVISSGVHVNRI